MFPVSVPPVLSLADIGETYLLQETKILQVTCSAPRVKPAYGMVITLLVDDIVQEVRSPIAGPEINKTSSLSYQFAILVNQSYAMKTFKCCATWNGNDDYCDNQTLRIICKLSLNNQSVIVFFSIIIQV